MSPRKKKIRSAFAGYTLTPKEDYYQSKKNGITAERVHNDPAYDSFRRHGQEMARISSLAGLIRQGLGREAKVPGKPTVLNRTLRKVLNTDKEHHLGERSFLHAEAAGLRDYPFHPAAAFRDIVKTGYDIRHCPQGKMTTVTLDTVFTEQDIVNHKGADACRLLFIMLQVNLMDNTCTVEKRRTSLLPFSGIGFRQRPIEFTCAQFNHHWRLLAATVVWYHKDKITGKLMPADTAGPLTIVDVHTTHKMLNS